MPPFKEYWRTSKGKQDTLSRIFAEPLDYEPGTKEVYSDLGIILMAEIVERLTGRTLDDLANAYIFDPLRMSNTSFRPAKKLWPELRRPKSTTICAIAWCKAKFTTKMLSPSAAFQDTPGFSAPRPISRRFARCC